ncbi:phosphopantetheine-binding protein [Streptomyces netropsis]|uniref:phosphopantetheine-binding protein n=1 Tax=Streptomyces netropsis TaxID=55404 RepID=UPI00378CB0A1
MYDRLAQLLVDEFAVEPALVSPDATFEALELDSLSLVELAVMITEETGIVVADMSLDTTLAQAAEHYAAAWVKQPVAGA